MSKRDKIGIIWQVFEYPHASRDTYLIIWQSIKSLAIGIPISILVLSGVLAFLCILSLWMILHLLFIPILLIHDKILELKQ